MGSTLDALNQIMKYILAEVNGKTAAQGYAIALGENWADVAPLAQEAFEALLEVLIFDLNVVVVVAAGEDFSESRGLINQYPATLVADSPIISVGAVDIAGNKPP